MYIPTIMPPARGVRESSIGYRNCVVVSPDDDLPTAYSWLKSTDRNGSMGALAADNRRVLILAPGKHTLSSQFELDTDYVDLVALCPAPGGDRQSSDVEWTGAVDTAAVSEGGYRPPPTLISGSLSGTSILLGSLVKQSASDVRLVGFGIVNRHDPGTTDIDTNTESDIYASAFTITTADNSKSSYYMMYFWMTGAGVWHTSPNMWTRMAVYSTGDFKGIWEHCNANGFAYRCAANYDFAATMIDCVGGPFSWAGDEANVEMKNCQLYRCKGVGYFNTAYEDAGGTVLVRSGYACFGACRSYGCNIDATAYFYECEAGDRSYGLGKTVAGNFYRCKGGNDCFGGFSLTSNYPTFSGYAEDCLGYQYSFAAGNSNNTCSGEFVNCRFIDQAENWFLTGAVLRRCFSQVKSGITRANIALLDGNSKIYDCEFYTPLASTCIWAAAAQNVVAAHNRMNQGYHANVTNLIGTSYDVIDTDIA